MNSPAVFQDPIQDISDLNIFVTGLTNAGMCTLICTVFYPPFPSPVKSTPNPIDEHLKYSVVLEFHNNLITGTRIASN